MYYIDSHIDKTPTNKSQRQYWSKGKSFDLLIKRNVIAITILIVA